MELIRLALTDWRGVAEREISFGKGVTIIEGPNESGKSTIVQSLYTLFKELDSSKKKDVKAIQPVGRDVGSSVEAEIRTGDYHFVYSKTYNKRPQTELQLLSPKKVQLTGREAHERVEQILGETVDMALWEALLVSQGEKIELTNLQDSDSLSKALDEAAGSSEASHEDSRLIDAVQAEYEQYYSLKAGKPRFADLEKRCEQAKANLEVADRRLLEVEADAQEHGRVAEEVRRLQSSVPDLAARAVEHQERWDAIQAEQGKLQAKRRELESAATLRHAAEERLAERRRLADAVRQSEKDVRDLEAASGPLKERVTVLKKSLAKARQDVTRTREVAKETRAAVDLAKRDAEYADNVAALAEERRRLAELDALTTRLNAALDTINMIRVTDALLDEIRTADRELDIVASQRDTAATHVKITAEQALSLQVDGKDTLLQQDESYTENVAARTTMRLPGVARIDIAPSESAADLKEKADEAARRLAEWLEKAEVADLSEAVAGHKRRAAAVGEADRFRQKRQSLLQGLGEDEVRRKVSELERACSEWQRGRAAARPLPGNPEAARAAVQAAERDYRAAETALEAARDEVERLQTGFETQDSQLRAAEKDIEGHKSTLKTQSAELKRQQDERPDDALEKQQDKARAGETQLRSELEGMEARLAEHSPETARMKLDNAREAHQRALGDLGNAEKRLAVLSDRLRQAQADGRYDEREYAERLYTDLQAALERTERRARAARLLWETLIRHRDSARRRYVQPLKDAIERLGALVFGGTFEVEIGDDWSIVTCTRDGETLPFDDLSIGAKEQLSILSRLAAAQIVSSQGGVPLIIDDALGFSDPQRLESMGAAIAAAARQSQIVILTCTPGRFAYIGVADVVKL